MFHKPKSGRSIGRQVATPPRLDKAPAAPDRAPSTNDTAAQPDPAIAQAKRDIDSGLVDTDMRATPGLDATRRAALVPGPGGKPPASGG